MGVDEKKIETMVVMLENPKTFNFTYVGIGCAEGYDDYLLVAFRREKLVFQKVFKTLDWAKRGFRRIVSKEIKTRAKWQDFAVTTKHKDRKTNGFGGIKFVKKI